jgi:hypothetical protein
VQCRPRAEPRQSREETSQSREQRIASVQAEVDKLIESRGELIERTSPTPNRCDRSSVESLLGSDDHLQRPTVKTQKTTDDSRAACSDPSSIARVSKQSRMQLLVGGYPIALWIGASKPGEFFSSALIKDDKIPSLLAYYLSTRMNGFVNDGNSETWDAMPPNTDTCILRYLIDRHRPSDQPQERRACRICSSLWVGHHRPCALLLKIGGIRTVVFMPLRDDLRPGVAWHEKGFWLLDA